MAEQKRRCVIYANCQGEGISRLLLQQDRYKDNFENIHISNFKLIQNRLPVPVEWVETADCFIYQPLSTRYGIYSSDNVLQSLPKTCKVFSFPYILNDALWPFAPSGNGLKGGDLLLKLTRKGQTVSKIIEAFFSQKIDCEFERRFKNTISVLEEKEKRTDIRVSGFILDNLKKRRLFTIQSHPTGIVLVHCVNQILDGLGYSVLDPLGSFLFDKTTFAEPWPNSPYELDYYKFEYVHEPDPNWKQFYSQEIDKYFYQNAQ